MIAEAIVIEATSTDGAQARILVEKAKRGSGIAFTILVAGRAIPYTTNEAQTHELRRAMELVSPEKESE